MPFTISQDNHAWGSPPSWPCAEGASAHASPCLRLCPRQQQARYPDDWGMVGDRSITRPAPGNAWAECLFLTPRMWMTPPSKLSWSQPRSHASAARGPCRFAISIVVASTWPRRFGLRGPDQGPDLADCEVLAHEAQCAVDAPAPPSTTAVGKLLLGAINW